MGDSSQLIETAVSAAHELPEGDATIDLELFPGGVWTGLLRDWLVMAWCG